jgi:hypothetical protein
MQITVSTTSTSITIHNTHDTYKITDGGLQNLMEIYGP